MGWKILDATGAEKMAATSGISTPTQTILTSGSGTYTVPAGCTEILVECIGGGGGGGGAAATAAGQASFSGAGGGGAYAASVITNPAASYAYSVGAGGNGGAAGANNGTAGSDTSFGGGIVLAKGGSPGTGGASTASTGFTQGGAGGAGSSSVGNEVMSGEPGWPGISWNSTANANYFGGVGGTAAKGGSGGVLVGTGSGVNGNAPGGGGSGIARPVGSGTAAAGGNGATGNIVITEFYGQPTASNIPVQAPTTTYLTASSGTYTTPANCAYIVVEAIGGGGAGGPANSGPASGGGGGGGAYAKKTIQNPSPTYAYVVGAGGTTTSYPTQGNGGGDTTFGSTVVVAKGGGGGAAGGTVTPPVPGGGPIQGGQASASTGDIAIDGGNSIVGFSMAATWVLGGIGGSGAGPYGGKTSVQRDSGTAAGVAGESYGGAGGGGCSISGGGAVTGGAGAPGIIVVTEYYQQPQQVLPTTASPKMTSQDFASGPPANPTNGDIWYATNVDGNGTVWQFRYNANSGSTYKWEFVGGGSFSQLLSLSSQVLSNGVFTNLTGMTFTPARGGDYEIVSGAIGTYGTSIVNSTIELCIAVAGTTVSTVATRSLTAPPSAFDWNLPGTPAIITSVAASSAITLQGFNNSTGYTWTQAGWAIRPRRVA